MYIPEHQFGVIPEQWIIKYTLMPINLMRLQYKKWLKQSWSFELFANRSMDE